MPTLIIHSNALSFEQTKHLERLGGSLKHIHHHYQAQLKAPLTEEQLNTIRTKTNLDINQVPDEFNAKDIKLLISDMDSTLIAIECVDEIADMMGLKEQVSEITEAAMRGEIDFETSLKQRVSLLQNLDESTLQQVYDERLILNPGAQRWISGLKEKGIQFALVSGGFTFFTDRLKETLQLEHTRANILEVHQGQLSGGLIGPIIDAQAKADFLLELCQDLNIKPHQVIAIGDGANDLLMMQEAGLSIAYHAKPTVQKQASTAINIKGLEAALDFIELE